VPFRKFGPLHAAFLPIIVLVFALQKSKRQNNKMISLSTQEKRAFM
jgi:hypothetical protein